jgi:hypothetical protein
MYAETEFFFHAILTGKIFVKPDRSQFSEFVSKQKILRYVLPHADFETVNDLRRWISTNGLTYKEGSWTFYIPPQKGIKRCFDFMQDRYPPDAGIKILKDFQPPDKARYTHHKQNPAPGAALKRTLTPSPTALVRVANYLYAHGLGTRIYDLVALQAQKRALSGYIVQHVEGPRPQQGDYDFFMKRLKALLERGEITTIHESIDIMHDFKPPNCSNNLLMSSAQGRPLFVDFQGFLLRNEDSLLASVIEAAKKKAHFGGRRFYRGGKAYLYQSIPGLATGKRDMITRWRHFGDMFAECDLSFKDRVVYDIGCNTGLMLYHSLGEGALWAFGWDLADVVESSQRLLLSLGATRFDLFAEEIAKDTDFGGAIPPRYQTRKNGVLFYLAMSEHIGFPQGVALLPWEYMFYEGHAKQDYECSIARFRDVPWLRGTKVLSWRSFADGDSLKRVVILLKR